MDLLERKNCPNCRSDSIQLYKKGTIDPNQLKSEDFKITDSHYGSLWTFFSCHNCNFVFANPYPAETAIIQFYSDLVDNEYHSEAEGRTKNFQIIINRLSILDKPDNTLLDIGAASGIFLNLARKAGYETFGIEPSAQLAKEAQQQYGINLFKGTIAQFPQDQQFSTITLLDILEHLVDPDQFMNQVASLIKKDGILIVVTPDINSITQKVLGKRWWHYRTAHLNFFNLKSLNYLLNKHGFSIIQKKRFAWHFSLYYLVTRFFPQLKGNNSLQKLLKSISLKLNLFDSWEIYAKKN